MKNINLFYVRHNKGQPCKAIDCQFISYYELTAVLHGRLFYEVNGESFEVNAGDAIIVCPNSIRTRPSESDVDYISFNFRTDDEICLPTLIKNALDGAARLIIEACDRIGEEYYFDNNEKNRHLLACLIALFEDRVRFEDLDPLTVKITSYINANLAKKITLDEIGKLTFFSPVYCDTVFKRETGRSIIDYLIERRIDEAKKYLMDTAMSLTQVAELCGFADYNYFCRVVKKRVSSTPTAYRKLMTDRMK